MQQKPEIVVTCKDHGEVARMPAGWTPVRMCHEIGSLPPCCKDGTITLVTSEQLQEIPAVSRTIEALAATEKDLAAAREEASQLRSEIELVRASAARQEAELLQVRDALRSETEGARQVLIRTLEPFQPVYTNQALPEVAGFVQKVVQSLVEEREAQARTAKNASAAEGQLLEQLTYIRRVLQDALRPFDVNLETDNMTLAALAAQRIELLFRDLARCEGNARVQDAALQELAPRRRVIVSEADRRYDVADAFKLDLYEGNAVVRLLNKDCPPAERIKHVERAAFYVDRLLRRLKSQSPAG